MHASDGTVGGVVQLHELAELGEAGTHEGEVVPVIQGPHLANALPTDVVLQSAAQGIAGVRRVGDHGVVPKQGHDLGNAVWLRFLRMDVKVPGHW